MARRDLFPPGVSRATDVADAIRGYAAARRRRRPPPGHPLRRPVGWPGGVGDHAVVLFLRDGDRAAGIAEGLFLGDARITRTELWVAEGGGASIRDIREKVDARG